MKKLLIVSLLALSSSVFAHGPHGHHGYYRAGPSGWHWVAPAIIGGVIGYELARPPVVVQPPVVYGPIPTVQTQTCGPWTEIQNTDGTITRTRTCTQ